MHIPVKKLKDFNTANNTRDYDNGSSNFHLLFRAVPSEARHASPPPARSCKRVRSVTSKKTATASDNASDSPDYYLRKLCRSMPELASSWFFSAQNAYLEDAWVVTCSVSLASVLMGDNVTFHKHTFCINNPFDDHKPSTCTMTVRGLPRLPLGMRPSEYGWHIQRLKINAHTHGRYKLRVLNLPDISSQTLARFTICAVSRFPMITADYNETRKAWQVILRYNCILDATYAHYANKTFTLRDYVVTSRLE